MKPHLGLKREQTAGVVELLTRLLADEIVLQTKTRNYHWNVTGLHFGPLHALFEKQYDELAEVVDEVAERIRAVGGLAIGTLSEFQEHTRLKEEPRKHPTARKMLGTLLEDLRAGVTDPRTGAELVAAFYECDTGALGSCDDSG